MSTPIQQIRSMIQDQPVFYTETGAMVAAQKVLQATYAPVVGSSVVVTGTGGPVGGFTVDEQNGVITFAAAPGAGSYTLQYNIVYLLDQTIQDFIDLEASTSGTDDIRVVAAMALDAIASQQALILKRIKLLDLDVDGSAVAKALREHAKALRDEALNAAEQESAFDFAEQVNDLPGFREKVLKDWMRENG